MNCKNYNVRLTYCTRHTFQISLYSLLFLAILYIFTKLQPILLSQHRAAFEIWKGNATEIGSSQGNSTKERRLLFIAILTHWRKWKRRASIRETWMTQCTGDKVRCLFFTDDVGTKEDDKQSLQTEISRNNDMILMPMEGNISDKYCERTLVHEKGWLQGVFSVQPEFKCA